MLVGLMVALKAEAVCTGDSSFLSATQCSAFQELYDATSGAKWSACANKTDPCACSTNFDNQYIHCANGSIIALNLGGVGITGMIPVSLAHMTDLQLLWLMSNQLTALPPLESMTKLQDLDLSWNNITSRIPDMSGLSQLTSLDLYANDLTGTIPESVGDLTKLRHLCVGKNSLSGHLPSTLAHLNSLETLNLEENQFSAEECEEARHLIPEQCSVVC